VVLGIAAGISQALLLREAMAALGGSELAWGTVMALWLVGMATGSRLGVRFGGYRAARWLALVTVVLAGVGVVLFRAAPAITGTSPGETITTWHAAWLWVAAVVPPAVAGGLAFPILARDLGDGGAGAAYGLEATGALIGGLALSLLLAPAGTAAALCLTAAVVMSLGRKPKRRVPALLGALALVLVSPAAGDLLAASGWRWAGHPDDLAHWRETRQQRIEVSSGQPTVLYADGRLVASYPDPYTVVPAGHLLMLLHPDPQRVFAVGCLTDGAVEAMARHPAGEILVVEDDPELVRRLPDWYGPDFASVLADPRIRLRSTDPIRAISDSGSWDLIVLRDGNPITVRHNRTRTLEFFRLCRSHLADDGVLVVRLELSDTYLGGSSGRLFEVMVSTLRSVFPQVLALPGEEILLVAGGPSAELSIDPATLEDRWHDRTVHDPLFLPEMLELLADPHRADGLKRVLENANAPVNTRRHPRAVLLAAGLLEARSRPALLRLTRALEGRPATPLAAVLGLAAAGLLLSALIRRPSTTTIAAVVGASSMGWWLLLMAAWQATLGSVYAEVGALTAAFMAGLVLGALWAARRPRPAKQLPLVLLAGAGLSGALASPIVFGLPLIVVPALLVVGGVLTGAAFAGVAELVGRGRTRRGAGIAFAADEAGAAVAALLVGILALPWAGTTATAIGLGILGLSAIPAAILATRQRS